MQIYFLSSQLFYLCNYNHNVSYRIRLFRNSIQISRISPWMTNYRLTLTNIRRFTQNHKYLTVTPICTVFFPEKGHLQLMQPKCGISFRNDTFKTYNCYLKSFSLNSDIFASEYSSLSLLPWMENFRPQLYSQCFALNVGCFTQKR